MSPEAPGKTQAFVPGVALPAPERTSPPAGASASPIPALRTSPWVADSRTAPSASRWLPATDGSGTRSSAEAVPTPMVISEAAAATELTPIANDTAMRRARELV
jgi:hypothetical protein